MTIDALRRDLRHGFRRLIRDARFTAAAIVVLGLGVGANTAMFSVINAALFREQAVADPGRLVDIYQNGANAGGLDGNSYPAYLDMAQYTDVFADTMAALVPLGVSYLDQGALRPAVVQYATASYLSVFGLRPALGRWFTPSEDVRGAEVVAVVGYQTWTRRFNADPSIVGHSIRIEGVPVRIVGVAPAGHNGSINLGIVTDFWLPIASLTALGAPPSALGRRPDEAALLVKARLREGVTVAQAQAAMTNLGARLAAEYPNEDPGKGISVFLSTSVRVHPQMDAALAPAATVLFAVVAIVLAIACSNLATLLLVRGAARAKEVSIRLALGATRAQLVRHLLTESVLLSAAAGVAGCLLAWWSIRSLTALELPISVDLTLDYRVLAFASALSLVTGVAFGLAPALESTRIDLVSALHDAADTRSPDRRWLTLKNALVVFQVAVSTALLGGTSVFLQMLEASRAQRGGFAIDGVAMIETDARYAGYSAAQAAAVGEEIRRRVASIPGVQAAVSTRGLPMQPTGTRLEIEGASAAEPVVAGAVWAGPGFFDALNIPILFGRALDVRDRRETPRVAVVSETMARQYFGQVNALGRRFRYGQDATAWFEIVGVARDTGTADLTGDLVDPTPQLFYRSFVQADVPPTAVVARTSLDAAALAGAMQREMRAVDASLPVVQVKTMKQHLEDSLTAPRAIASLLAAIGALALALAGIGLYAVVAFAVSRRAREIGIRMALGARSQQVVGMVATEVAVLVGTGTAAGLLMSVLGIFALRAAAAPAPGMSLYRPSADPIALLAIAGFMALVGLASASMPAWRAARMDPLTALRHD